MTPEKKQERYLKQREWVKRNKEHSQAYHKAYREDNPDKILEYREKYNSNGTKRYYQIKYKYGLTEEAFHELAVVQDGKCAICRRAKKLCVDHDHDDGHVRGLLCQRCNSGLGQFEDNPELLEKALHYLTNDITQKGGTA